MKLKYKRPTRFLIAAACISLLLTACGGGGGGSSSGTGTNSYTVTASAGAGGSFDRTSATVNEGSTTSFTLTPDAGYRIDTVSGCDGSLSGATYTTGAITADCTVTASFVIQYTVTASAGAGGSFDRTSAAVDSGSTTSFTVTPDTGYSIDTVSGCGGSLSGNTYTTGVITADCTVSASFAINQYTVTASAGANGTIAPTSATVNHGSSTSFTVTPDVNYHIDSVSGCGGSLSGTTYTTGSITADCTVSASFTDAPASAPSPTLGFGVKQLQFTWPSVAYTDHYRILVNPDGASGFSVVTGAESITTLGHNVDVSVHQLDWVAAEYLVEACNADNSICLSSANQTVTPADSVAATGYFKASNRGKNDYFGWAVALSGDGNTLAVGAFYEDSVATGVDGNQSDDTLGNSGAVYVFSYDGSSWSQQAYLKASNTGYIDTFGESLSLSADGNTLAVGAKKEDSAATGINGNQADDTAVDSGAVYVFTRSGAIWSQQAYIKASNTEAGDMFGHFVSLTNDGNTLAVGAPQEASAATGINGAEGDNTATAAGATYVFSRSGTTWSQQAYIKASNTDANDQFGASVSLSGDGTTLAVGADQESSVATGIDGDQTSNTQGNSGAVYVFSRSGTVWSQQAYVKASNTNTGDSFGYAVSLASDGNTLAVGAYLEDSIATGIGGNQTDNSYNDAGAVYVFSRSGVSWSQQAYIKASNTEVQDYFGWAVALSGDGNTLAVAAKLEDSAATGVGGSQSDNTAGNAGAVYVFSRSGAAWSQQTYVKASNTDSLDIFAQSISLSSDGATLAVGAYQEDSCATGVGGANGNYGACLSSGAAYLY